MPLNPPPTIESGLGIVTQELIRSDMTRAAIVTYGLSVTGSPGPSVAQDAIDDFQSNFNTNMMAHIDNEVTARPPQIKLGDGSNVAFVAVAAGSPGVGGASSTTVPPNVALLIKKVSALSGKKNRGRTYLPFALDVAHVSENGTVDGATVTAYQTDATNFLNQLITDATAMVIVNKTFNTPLPPHFVTALTFGGQVTSYLVENIIATQRRRVRS